MLLSHITSLGLQHHDDFNNVHIMQHSGIIQQTWLAMLESKICKQFVSEFASSPALLEKHHSCLNRWQHRH